MKHIIIPLGIVIIGSGFVWLLRVLCIISGEQMGYLLAVIPVVSGYMYTSLQNTREQTLRYRREMYAQLMEGLIIFKTGSSHQNASQYSDAMNRAYYRSWIEASDEVYTRFDAFAQAYERWTKAKNDETRGHEEARFSDLVAQMRREVNGKSDKVFRPYVLNVNSTGGQSQSTIGNR